ncbi:MAG: pilus assembly protein TadG-related protein [Isosphaeraceae bacterium]
MRHFCLKSPRLRRGLAVVMFGVLLPVFIGFTALAVDTAMIAVAQGQLGTAADSAALAGAMQLADENRVRGATNLTTEITGANTEAVAFAQANKVLGASPVLSMNTSNATTGQIIVGYLDPKNPSSTLNTSSSLTSVFNSVQVTLYRDASHGGVVPTVFAQLMGFHGSSVTVSSTATAWPYQTSGFQANGSACANLLPIVLDMNTWLNMMPPSFQFLYMGQTLYGNAGPTTATDQYTYNTTNNTVTSGADGIYESLLYPVGSGSPGNWGTIKVGVSNNSTSTLNSQILNGITPTQLATFPGSTIALSGTDPPSITFGGNPGISAGIKSSLNAIIGQPVFVPIYDSNGGNGNNAWYRVIYFQPARILSVCFQGNPKYVIIQPCLASGPTLMSSHTPQQSWSAGGQIQVYLSR